MYVFFFLILFLFSICFIALLSFQVGGEGWEKDDNGGGGMINGKGKAVMIESVLSISGREGKGATYYLTSFGLIWTWWPTPHNFHLKWTCVEPNGGNRLQKPWNDLHVKIPILYIEREYIFLSKGGGEGKKWRWKPVRGVSMININCGVEEPTRGFVIARENSIKYCIVILGWYHSTFYHFGIKFVSWN